MSQAERTAPVPVRLHQQEADENRRENAFRVCVDNLDELKLTVHRLRKYTFFTCRRRLFQRT